MKPLFTLLFIMFFFSCTEKFNKEQLKDIEQFQKFYIEKLNNESKAYVEKVESTQHRHCKRGDGPIVRSTYELLYSKNNFDTINYNIDSLNDIYARHFYDYINATELNNFLYNEWDFRSKHSLFIKEKIDNELVKAKVNNAIVREAGKVCSSWGISHPYHFKFIDITFPANPEIALLQSTINEDHYQLLLINYRDRNILDTAKPEDSVSIVNIFLDEYKVPIKWELVKLL